MLKKVIIFAILSALLFSSFSFISGAFELDKSEATIEGYYLYDLNHNLLMQSENTDTLISPSSTAKIMAACVILESNIDFTQKITVTKAMLSNVMGRSMLLKEGNVLTVEDLLYAMLCGGYNDATHILALTVSSSLSDFTKKMNEKAIELEMNDTHYLNPTGIDVSGMYTTINDISKLARYISNNQVFVDICSTKSYRLSKDSICDYTTITNRSSLLTDYKGLSSFNVGSSDSGDCAVIFYQTSELALISIVMNAKLDDENTKINYAEKYSKELISYAIHNYSTKLIKSQNDIIISLPVKYSMSSNEINVYLQKDLTVFLSDEISIDEDLIYSIYIQNGELIAPLKSGDIIGTLTVFYDGVMLANVPLIVEEAIDRNAFLYSMDLIKQFILSKTFLITLILFLFLIIYNSKSRKHKFRKKKRKIRKKPT